MEDHDKKNGILRVWGIEMPFKPPSQDTVNTITMFIVLVSALKVINK